MDSLMRHFSCYKAGEIFNKNELAIKYLGLLVQVYNSYTGASEFPNTLNQMGMGENWAPYL